MELKFSYAANTVRGQSNDSSRHLHALHLELILIPFAITIERVRISQYSNQFHGGDAITRTCCKGGRVTSVYSNILLVIQFSGYQIRIYTTTLAIVPAQYGASVRF